MNSGQFSQDEIAEFRQVFAMFDRNHNGQVTASDLNAIMHKLGTTHAKDEEIRDILNQVDPSGVLDFDGFLALILRSRKNYAPANKEEARRKAEEEMRQAFKVFDRDGNGLIDQHELKTTMKNLGEKLSKNDIKAMVKAADKNGDGKIDYEEFIRMMYAQST